MPNDIQIRVAAPEDAALVSGILTEAAQWLEHQGMTMWFVDELTPDRVAPDVAAGLFVIAESSGEPAGVMKLQLEDSVVWPDRPQPDAAYIHRLAVRRRFAGTGVAAALVRWARQRARELGRAYLRIDCDANRKKLRQLYEGFGFAYDSDRYIGKYFVARYELPTAKQG